MYKHILIPVALAAAQKDYAAATEIARKLLAEGGQRTALHVLR